MPFGPFAAETIECSRPIVMYGAANRAETLLSRLANIEVAPARNDVTHTPSFILRGLKHLHLTFDRA